MSTSVTPKQSFYLRYGKRLFDLAIVLPLLPVLIPICVIVAILVRVKLGAPTIFAQTRPGLGGKLFKLFKFRSMTDARDADGNLLPDDRRLPRFGQLLRKSSLDELPEIVNVLRGEMSLVGPRPLLPEYLTRYSPQQARRHETLPGITGWAQINGRNALDWESRFELDVWYVDNASLWLDIKILYATLAAVVAMRDVNQPGHATAQVFMGSSPPNDEQNHTRGDHTE